MSGRCPEHAGWAACSEPRQVLDTTVSVCVQEGPVDDAVLSLLQEFPAATEAMLRFRVGRGGDPDSGTHVQLSDQHRMLYDGYSPTACATLLMTRINRAAMRATTASRTVLHAGAVRHGDVVVALPAAMEAGKTTLVAGLLDAGFDYLSDELVPVADELSVVPYPKPLSVDRGSWPVLPRWAPERPAVWDEQRLVHRREVTGRAPAPGGQLGLVVLPKYSPADATTVDRISGSRALIALLGCAYQFEEHPRRDLDRLAAVVRRVPVYELTVRDLVGGVRTVMELVRRHS